MNDENSRTGEKKDTDNMGSIPILLRAFDITKCKPVETCYAWDMAVDTSDW